MSMQMFATSSKMTACDTYQLLSHEVVAHRGEGGELPDCHDTLIIHNE